MMARGWLGLFVLSVRLGLGYVVRRRAYLREAVVRVVVPLDPSRYLEFPETLRELAARAGESVVDLASPKLVAVHLARQGVEVVSVDELESEIATWKELAGDTPGLTFAVADGRALPFADESFDHAYSISVLEHIPGHGDAAALLELARVIRPGGRIVVTLPYADVYREDWRDSALYADHGGENGRHFFGRWYDVAHVDALRDAVAPALAERGRRLARLSPMAVNRGYERFFPALVPLGWLFAFLVHEVDGPGGDMMRVTYVKQAQ
jgi:SAM-dependent methyltransferase